MVEWPCLGCVGVVEPVRATPISVASGSFAAMRETTERSLSLRRNPADRFTSRPRYEPYCSRLSDQHAFVLCGSLAGQQCAARRCGDTNCDPCTSGSGQCGASTSSSTASAPSIRLDLGDARELRETERMTNGGRDVAVDYALERGRDAVQLVDDWGLNGGLPQTVLIFGGPGSGKSYLFKSLLAQMLKLAPTEVSGGHAPGGLLLDPKGSLGDALRRTAERFRPTHPPIILGNVSEASRGNLLAAGSSGLSVDQQAAILTEAVTALFPSESDWKPLMLDVILGALVTASLRNERLSLALLATYFVVEPLETSRGWSYQPAFLRGATAAELEDRRVATALQFFESTESQFARHLLAALGRCFGTLAESRWSSLSATDVEGSIYDGIMERGDVVLVSIGDGDRIVREFVVTVAKALFQAAVAQRGSRTGAGRDRLVFLASDEYGAVLVEADQISDSDFFSRSREFKCLNLLALQSVHMGLKRVGEQQAPWNAILGNANVKVFFSVNDPETAQLAMELGGSYPTKREVASTGFGTGGPSVGTGEAYAETPRVPKPVVLRGLARGDAVAIGRLDGRNPVVEFFHVPEKIEWRESP